jgi:hypothetical protein
MFTDCGRIKEIVMNNTNNALEQIEIIKWAFEKGYSLAKDDMKDGIHISLSEIRKNFLQDLVELLDQEKLNAKPKH